MPASYAHYRFGKLLLPQLPPQVRQTIQRFRRMYDLGLQGPDFFFYSIPVISKTTADFGRALHRQSGQEFFPTACKAATSDAARAYLYGLLAHYCLDSICHPFIKRLVEIEEARHVPLESEFERFLLTLDGEKSPQTFDMSKYLKVTRGECMTIAEFYPGTAGGTVFCGIHGMAFFTGFLAHPNRPWRENLLRKINPRLCDFMIPAEEDQNLAPYIRELQHLYGQALARYPEMLSQLTAHLKTGEDFGEAFASTFG